MRDANAEERRRAAVARYLAVSRGMRSSRAAYGCTCACACACPPAYFRTGRAGAEGGGGGRVGELPAVDPGLPAIPATRYRPMPGAVCAWSRVRVGRSTEGSFNRRVAQPKGRSTEGPFNRRAVQPTPRGRSPAGPWQVCRERQTRRARSSMPHGERVGSLSAGCCSGELVRLRPSQAEGSCLRHVHGMHARDACATRTARARTRVRVHDAYTRGLFEWTV